MENAIILVSGGMDSCVTAAIAKSKNVNLFFLHASYGQRTQRRELRAFQNMADFYNVSDSLIIDMTHLSKIGGSSLTDHKINIPTANLNSNNIPNSYVPFRNANILSAATSWAEIINASRIYIGAVEEDSSGYPDCRRIFFDFFEKTIESGTKPDTNIKIETPLISLSKKEIVQKGIKMSAPLDLTWSCYKRESKPCGKCDSCALRQRGFKLANEIDPILKQ